MQIRLATSAEKTARDMLTHAAWGQRLTLEQYLERERRLRAHPYPREAMRTWLLIGGEGEGVLASCETFAMRAYLPRQSAAASLSRVEGVASVFVEERLRGRGLAVDLMDALGERLRQDGALASILFSDVGLSIYERSGYVARPAISRVFEPEPGDPAGACDRVLTEVDAPKALHDACFPDDALLIWPTATQLDWHLERERIYAALLGAQRPACHAALAGTGRAVFCADLKSARLMILQLAARRTDEALALIQVARRVAHQAGLSEVVLWECAWPFELSDDAGGGRRVRRTEALPMICPLRKGVDPASWGQTSRATWV